MAWWRRCLVVGVVEKVVGVVEKVVGGGEGGWWLAWWRRWLVVGPK